MRAGWACLFLALSAAAAQAEVAVTDALGRRVLLEAPASRIVTIFSSNTEIVTALGLARSIVGIDAFTRYPPEIAEVTHVGGRLGFSVDRVAAQRPDLVIVTPARQAVHQLVEPMERIGVPILVLTHRSVGEVLDNLRLVSRLTWSEARAGEVIAALEARLATVARRIAGRARPSVVMVTGRLGNGLLLVTRARTYTADAVLAAGGRLAFEDAAMLASVSPEAILGADPDVLLFAGAEGELRDLLAWPGWSRLRALREGRVHTVSRAEFLIPGPRVVDGIENLARVLHGDTAP